MLSCLVLCLSLIAGISAHYGKCPDVPTKQDFDLNRYLGTWYESMSYGNEMQKLATSCPKAEYKLNDQGTVDVTNTGLLRIGGMKTTFEATAAPLTDGKDGKFTVSAKALNLIKAPYWVLDTDYDNYAIVFSCMDFLNTFHVDSVWVLTRNRFTDDKLPADLNETIMKAMENSKLDPKRLKVSSQKGCTV